MRRLIPILATMLFFGSHAWATDVTIGATTQPNFNPTGLTAATTLTGVTVTSGTNATLTCNACFRTTWVGLSGFYVTVGLNNYYVKSVDSTSQVTLASDCPEMSPATVIWNAYVEVRIYADRAFQPAGKSYIVQPGTPGSGAWYKRYGASILTLNGVKTLYIPEIVIDATTDAVGPTNQARYTLGFYRPDNSLIQLYSCADQFKVPPVTPTSWGALCQYNSPPAIVPPANEAYTKTQIDARLISCSVGQMIYYAATGNQPTCLTVGTGLAITNGSILTTGGVVQGINIITDYGCNPADEGGSADQTCFQSAINAAAALGGKTVYVPTGVYNVSGLTIPGGVTVVGDGRNRSIIKSATNAAILSLTQGAGDFLYYGPSIKGLGILGNVASGINQDGISVTDATYLYNVRIDSVDVRNTGGDGLYIGNTYSSWFSDLYFDGITEFPVHYNAINMPGNVFDKLYVANLTTSKRVAYRVRGGEFICRGCNGVKNILGGSQWAVVGRKDGVDGDTVGASARFTCIDCNMEGWLATAITSYYGSTITLKGDTKIQMDIGGFGTGRPILFDLAGNGSAYYSEKLPRGYIEDSVQFTVRASYYRNSQPIHADGYPPIQTLGSGPWITTDTLPARVSTFYRSDISATRNLPRADSMASTITVTATTALSEPYGVRYVETNCSSACTLTIPWAGWYAVGDTLTIKNISSTIAINNVTINTSGGGTINGASSFTLNRNNQVLVLRPDGVSDWRLISPAQTDTRQSVNAADFGCDLTDSATDDSTCIANAIAAAQASTGKVLYLPAGTYNVSAITSNLNSLTIEGDGPGKTVIKARASNYNVVNVSGSGYGYRLTLRDLAIQGAGKAAGSTGHCVYINDSNSYLSEFQFSRLNISNCRQDGIHIPYIFSGIIERVTTDAIGEDHFDIGGGTSASPAGSNTITLLNNYVKTVEAYRAGYRIRTGGVTMIGNNGMAPDSAVSAFWGIFGQKSISQTGTIASGDTTITSVTHAGYFTPGDEVTISDGVSSGVPLVTVVTAVNSGSSTITVLTAPTNSKSTTIASTDTVDAYFRGAFIGNNIEDFGAYGIRLKENSKFGSISGNSFLTSGNTGTHIALKYDYAGTGYGGPGTTPSGYWDQSNTLSLAAGSWASGAAIHSQGVPFIVTGDTPSQYYETSFPGLVDLPTFSAAWDGTYGKMFLRIPYIQAVGLKLQTVTQTALSAIPVSSGVVLFCTDCKAHSTDSHCDPGGPGSLAIGVGSIWVCK